MLSLETERKPYIVCGDVNINLLNKNLPRIKEYVDSLCCVGCSQLVDIPTRFSNDNKRKPSLLDHIYTNINKHSTKSGVCLFDISDHLPVFLILNNVKLATQTKIKFIRCMKKFNLDEFLIDLMLQLEGSYFESLQSSVNDDVQLLSVPFKSIIDKHAPSRTMSRKELRLNKKPWITKGILISIKTKNKLFKKFVKNSNQMDKANYKKYLNKLTHVKNFSKRLYYENVIKSTHNDSSKT